MSRQLKIETPQPRLHTNLPTAWIRSDRWEALPPEEQDGFPPLCPDFVIELRSKTDRLVPIQTKMEGFIANGAVLGFLIDPKDGCAHIDRPGTAPQILLKPDALSGDPELPGMVIDLTKIW